MSGTESHAAGAVGPSPHEPHPLPAAPQVCFVANTVDNPQISIGEYTYYDDPEDPEGFERNVLYLFPFIGDRLVIGRYCAIGRGARFVMNGANHRLDGISTYPFWIFGRGWERAAPPEGALPHKGDTVVGSDVWIGYDALVMPGVAIGHGAIVSTRSVVTRDVPPYAIVGGNPARVIRTRFSDDEVERLLRVAWWDWPVERVTEHLERIVGGDVAALEAVAVGASRDSG